MKWDDNIEAGRHDDRRCEASDELDAAMAEHLRTLVRACAERGDLPTDAREIVRRILWLQRLVYWARRR